MSFALLSSIGPVFLAALLPILWVVVIGAALGAACVAYGALLEQRWYRQAAYRLAILPEGARPLTLLHLSDLHYYGGGQGKADFLASLPRPDVTVITGDFLGEPEAVEDVVAALRPVRGRLASFFVLGSNDYFAPRPLNYFSYFRWRRRRRTGIPGRGGDLIVQLRADGWHSLRNERETLVAPGLSFEVVGLDDPHIERHDLRTARRTDPGATGLAIVHSPDPAPELAALGYQLILAGHTHGGQVRIPFAGALVTNGTTPAKLSMGLSRVGGTYLHVSPGLGTSKYAPFRFLCRPEATLLELLPVVHATTGAVQRAEETASSNTRS